MNSKLMNGSKEGDYGLVFPATWAVSSKRWAAGYPLPQAEIDAIERKLVDFRRKCADHRRGVFTVDVFAVGDVDGKAA